MHAEVIDQSCAVLAAATRRGGWCRWLAGALALASVVVSTTAIDAAVRAPQKPGGARRTTNSRPSSSRTTNSHTSNRSTTNTDRRQPAGYQTVASRNAPKASSSRQAQKEAIASLPLQHLTPEQRKRVASVTSRTTVFRRMPAQVVRCDPDMYLFLVEHPEVLANIWGLAAQQQAPTGIQEINLTRTGPNTLKARDGLGTQGDVEILYRSHDKHLLYASGAYDGPLFLKPVEGHGLLYLTTAYAREPDGTYYMTCQLEAFIALERSGTELLARTFAPIVGKVADVSFVQSLAFVQMLADISEVNPTGIDQLMPRLEYVQRDVCDEFSLLAATAAARAERRRLVATQQKGAAMIRQARPQPTGTPRRR